MNKKYRFICHKGEKTTKNKDMGKTLKMGTIVLGRYNEDEDWEETEFLKYDEHLRYGKYVCLTTTHDGKMVDCFDEIKLMKY